MDGATLLNVPLEFGANFMKLAKEQYWRGGGGVFMEHLHICWRCSASHIVSRVRGSFTSFAKAVKPKVNSPGETPSPANPSLGRHVRPGKAIILGFRAFHREADKQENGPTRYRNVSQNTSSGGSKRRCGRASRRKNGEKPLGRISEKPHGMFRSRQSA